MAGFFGFFNYEKEGPGISKNGPKKKTFIVFFETFFRNLWKFMPINFVYILLNLPILTNGLRVQSANLSRNANVASAEAKSHATITSLPIILRLQ